MWESHPAEGWQLQTLDLGGQLYAHKCWHKECKAWGKAFISRKALGEYCSCCESCVWKPNMAPKGWAEWGFATFSIPGTMLILMSLGLSRRKAELSNITQDEHTHMNPLSGPGWLPQEQWTKGNLCPFSMLRMIPCPSWAPRQTWAATLPHHLCPPCPPWHSKGHCKLNQLQKPFLCTVIILV